MEHFGFTVTYARELVAVMFGDTEDRAPLPVSPTVNSR